MSDGPPAGKLLTKVIGLVGKPCALAALATRLNVAADSVRRALVKKGVAVMIFE